MPSFDVTLTEILLFLVLGCIIIIFIYKHTVYKKQTRVSQQSA